MTAQELFDRKSLDKSDMRAILSEFPEQIKRAVDIGRNSEIPESERKTKKYFVFGMGGSAIGGDLVKSYLAGIPGADDISIRVVRDYDLPGDFDADSFAVGSSYSGGTEETISAFSAAAKVSKNLACVTTGGKLGEIARDLSIPLVEIPGGMQPRCALGYSFFAILYVLIKSGAFEDSAVLKIESDIEETMALVEKKVDSYSKFEAGNPALELALKIKDTIPIVYSSDRFAALNARWRGQFQENAKSFAFGSVLPEMNHNEINGWDFPAGSANNFSIITLEDPEDSERVKIRFKAIKEILSDKAANVSSFSGDGESFLARLFDLICLSDAASYFLALGYGVNPTEIPVIGKLKSMLAES